MLSRRCFVQALAATGIGTATLHRSIASSIQDDEEFKVTAEIIRNAEWISGNELTDEQRKSLVGTANQALKDFLRLRESEVDYFDPPAVHFETLEHDSEPDLPNRQVHLTESAVPKLPSTEEQIAFLPVTELAALIRDRQISSVDLTQIYLKRLRKYDPMLKCVVTLTEELALEQAKQADREIQAGRYRGPLHGIPWGAKDLVSIPGYPTSWGIPQFRDRIIDQKATVAQRLEQAGAVLVAKLSLGAIAMGDRWFGGMTRSPWNPEVGSSGSSAGSASATVAGLVGFSIGTETLGSIVSPSRQCGATGLRPTFGRVSRAGCMPLSWTMDKIGPITRSVEDTALVLAAIHGADGVDATAINKRFSWPPNVNLQKLRVGYVKSRRDVNERPDLIKLRDIGVELVEISLPKSPNIRTLTKVIGIEGAAIFEEMLNRNETDGWNAWPGIFRSAQFVSAVDYLRIMRLRRKLMVEMEDAVKNVDVLVNANDLLVTNLTGHPSIVVPRGVRERNEKFSPITDVFTGHLFDETRMLALALAYEQKVEGNLKHPPLDDLMKKMSEDEQEEKPGSKDKNDD